MDHRWRFVVATAVLFGVLVLTAAAEPVALRRDGYSVLEPAMVQLPGGCFDMGSPNTESGRQPNEQLHTVCVETFAIGRFEVTFEEYDRFVQMANYPGAFGDAQNWFHKQIDNRWGRERRPVVYVSLDDAVAYTVWLSEQTGEQYRLPTEAEWEYAARAGASSVFNTGALLTTGQANYNGTQSDDSVPAGEFRKKTLPVGSFAPNAWGLYDMHGNVREWTCSPYDQDYGGKERVCQQGQRRGEYAVRGGDWYSLIAWLRLATRLGIKHDTHDYQTGFRLVRETARDRLPPQLVRLPFLEHAPG